MLEVGISVASAAVGGNAVRFSILLKLLVQ